MIRKFLSFLVIATISMSLNFAKAQICTPDTNLKAPGFLPNKLQDAQINQAYSQSITVLAFKDTTVKQGPTTVKVYIDSMKITGFLGLPNGLTYNCLSPSCAFTPKALSCAVIKGTPTESGVFPLKVVIMIYAKISGIIPYSTTDTIRSFAINVAGSAGAKMINLNELNVYPNPTSGLTYITSLVQPRIYNAVGQLLNVDLVKNDVGYSFDSRLLKSGIYSVVCGNKSIKLVVD
jgi:hypothetical protein